MTVSPSLTLPLRTATSIANGIEAADVLPCWSTVTMTLSSASLSFLAVPSMMRMLAWWGISQSMSDSVLPALTSTDRATSASTPTASLKTAWPSILRVGSPKIWPPLTLPGTHSTPTCLPSACSSVARMPGRSDASKTTAPAPSPNSTQVLRSLKSRMRLKTSLPTTSAHRAAPVLIMLSATVSA